MDKKRFLLYSIPYHNLLLLYHSTFDTLKRHILSIAEARYADHNEKTYRFPCH